MSLQSLLSSTPVSFASFLVIMDRCWRVTQLLKLKGQLCVSAAYGQCRTFTSYCFDPFHWQFQVNASAEFFSWWAVCGCWWFSISGLSQGSLLSCWDFLMRVDLCRSEACIERAHKVVFNEMTAEGSLMFLKLLGVKMTVIKVHFEWKYSCHFASIVLCILWSPHDLVWKVVFIFPKFYIAVSYLKQTFKNIQWIEVSNVA